MTVHQLTELLKHGKTHRLIVGDRPGPYALGITNAPSPRQGAAFLLKIADPAGIPTSVELEGEQVPVIVQGGFAPPVPLR